MPKIDPDILAEKVTAAILRKDQATVLLGMQVDAVGAGRVTLSMDVRPEMINGHDLCHGGYIFTLADSACAIASNSRNVNMVLQSSTITYLNAAKLGDRLTAVGEEQSIRGRSGVIDVAVSDQDDTLVALFRGLVRRIPGHTLADYAEDSPA
ncbi:MAG: hotdog fold thioesterase [Proteobacteria bacterium]|nr:hotdog fold thioesterase [Pseudomonadota bacterium]